MKRRFVVFSAVLAIAVILLSVFLANGLFTNPQQSREFYIGVEYAYADDTAQLKALVDKVKDYTNLFVIGSIAISFNRSALDESCDYITQSGLNLIVFFTGIDRYSNWTSSYTIRDWMADAQQRYGDKFLGIYKIDEPGGNQIDQGNSTIIHSAASYTQASESYVGNLTLMNNYYHPYTPRLFTADYALHWFDYKAGYSGVFAEFVGNESRQRIIAQTRGAATAFQRDWGVIINWKYNQPPHYLESGIELYSDLSLVYSAGAKYAIVFSYPNMTGSSYGILEDEHFTALQRFWSTLNSNPDSFGSNTAQVAYVVPKDYGFGFRSAGDSIWGLFPSDSLSAKIYGDVQTLTDRYGAAFDILYDEPEVAAQLLGNYSNVFYWNQSIT